MIRRTELKSQKPSLDAPFALDFDHTAGFEGELILELFVDRARYLNRVGDATRFHSTGQIDGVAPQIVDIFALADDARHHRDRC